jgi:hypothetical protein
VAIPIWIQLSAAAVGLIGGSAGVISSIYPGLIVKRVRDDRLRKDISRAWTNEGDISSTETNFITVELKLTDGYIVGKISTNADDRLLRHMWILDGSQPP